MPRSRSVSSCGSPLSGPNPCRCLRRIRAISPWVIFAWRACSAISEGTVYNYLPVNIGDHSRRSACARRCAPSTPPASSATCSCAATALPWWWWCRSVPSIESFEITGNKDIKTEDLQKSLRNVGLAAGKTFDRSVLEDVSST